MEDLKITRISLIIAMIGIILLIIMSNKINTDEEYSAINLNKFESSNERVAIDGEIVNTRVSNGVTIIAIQVTEEIDIVVLEELYLMDDRIDKLENIANKKVNVRGRLQTNQYGKSILADEVIITE